MRERLRTAVDITLGAALTGWRQMRSRAGELAETGRAGRQRVQERIDRETETWRETGREQVHEVEGRVREEVNRALRGMNLVTGEELERLGRQIAQLQARVAELERREETREAESDKGDSA